MKVYTANITCLRQHRRRESDYGRKEHPRKQFHESTEGNFHTRKHSSRQSIYTKATRIFLQHQILRLYTAWFFLLLLKKVSCGLSRPLLLLLPPPSLNQEQFESEQSAARDFADVERTICLSLHESRRGKCGAAGKWLFRNPMILQSCPPLPRPQFTEPPASPAYSAGSVFFLTRIISIIIIIITIITAF